MGNLIYYEDRRRTRVAIPADLCHQYGLEPGDKVVLEATPDGIVLRPLEEVRAFSADIQPAGGLLSEESLRDRREDAERKHRGRGNAGCLGPNCLPSR